MRTDARAALTYLARGESWRKPRGTPLQPRYARGVADQNDDDAAAQRFHDAIKDVLGPCDSVFHVPREQQEPGTPHIDVFIYFARRIPFHLLVTAGMSSRAQGSPETSTHRPRVELYAKLPAHLERPTLVQICRALWALAQWPFRGTHPRFLAEWHMVHGLPPIAEGSQLDAFLLTMPLASDRPMEALGKRLEAQLLHAYGMTDGERRILESLDPTKLPATSLALMRAAGPFTDPDRAEIDLLATFRDSTPLH